MLKLALPNKGRLSEDVRSALYDAGLQVRASSDRALVASLGDEFSAIFVRAEDIPEFVADGAADLGITGWDCVEESGRKLESLVDLEFGRCRLVVAVPRGSGGEAPTLAAIPNGARVATSFPRLAERFFQAHKKAISLVPVSGAAEVAPHLGIADAIVDLVSSGSTLRVNGLEEVVTVVESSARLIARPREEILAHSTEKLEAIDELAMALSSVVRARSQRYLMANAPRAKIDAVREVLPGISGPTVIEVRDGAAEFVAVHAVVPQKLVYRTVSRLKALGCSGILVTRIERLLP
jgi:ATP phosphoribosyltransferase